jgi:hypothetical protein
MERLRELANKLNAQEEKIQDAFEQAACSNPDPYDWSGGFLSGHDHYCKYLELLDPANKKILDAYIDQNPKMQNWVRRYGYKKGHVTKSHIFVRAMFGDKDMITELLNAGYNFTPRCLLQRKELSMFLDIVVLLAQHGQISAEYMCWYFSKSLSATHFHEINNYLIPLTTRFPELQVEQLQALLVFSRTQGYTDAANDIKSYLVDAKLAMCQSWEFAVQDNALRDDNVFIHIIVPLLF